MDQSIEENWYSDDQATFGDRLAGARDAASMTQKELAAKLGIKLKTLKAWENDLTEPRANKLSMVSGLLGVSMTWLLTGDGEGPTEPSENADIAPDVLNLLSEVRDLRVQMTRNAERLGQLEKRLRAALKE
ncbi:transcriptional regulator [Marivivens niveibacter]|uniref:Transcriptional regulator n=1 Tax=Marivivens niveibacter TaxID=1930667 RepID=A0A251WYQ1_9RHOB|nr:helix-turn-helix domain-containing protein [Marivivens niveibacter]OUD09265.1 transcriptional regulator [Marivivens niveibacter]